MMHPNDALTTAATDQATLFMHTLPTKISEAMGLSERPAKRHALNLLINEAHTHRHASEWRALNQSVRILGALVDGA